MRYQHIVFDIDNTLLDSETALLTTWQQTLQHIVGKSYTIDQLRPILGMTGAIAITTYGITDLPTGYKVWGEYYMTNHKSVDFFPGVIEMLQKLKESGLKLGVITSRKRSEYDAEPLMKELKPYIDTIICSDNTPRPKPDGAPIESYCRVAKTTPSEMIYIGDTFNDFMCARNGGCHFGLSELGVVEKEKIEADYYFDSTEKMLEILLG